MADLKISELTDGSPLLNTDDIPIRRGGLNFRVNVKTIGSTANAADFPNAEVIISQADTGVTNSNFFALILESVASSNTPASSLDARANAGTGAGEFAFALSGTGTSNLANIGRGLGAFGKVTNSSDTADSVAGILQAIDTHAGGDNKALVLNAANGASNFAMESIAGDWLHAGATTFSALNVAGGIVQTDTNGLLSSSTTLPDGTLATTQATNDNSTKVATTAYVDTISNLVQVTTKVANAIAALVDNAKVIEFVNGASAFTYTLPQNSDVAFAVGSFIEIRKTGVGDITITKGTGATFRSVLGDVNIKVDGEDGFSVFVEKTATNTWLVSGNVKAV